ncbi:uncharacterized protein LOC117124593 [Anneissia japonica]|uniref:uncharacterized protein LOC117124593 n=1 Tax=Anneissia japonica TaxID=1529436 RepID=UPI001425A823|nr:uncharacterized protein LOC117124593 [Anneissia japonica]
MEVVRKSLQLYAKKHHLWGILSNKGSNCIGLTCTTFIRGKADIGKKDPIFNHNELKLMDNESEKSWVSKFLYGSGPSADVEPDTEMVEVEARYMEVLQESKEKIIQTPEVRKPVYNPPADVRERIQVITMDVCPDVAADTWCSKTLDDNLSKFKILARCNNSFKHGVPNFLLNKMKTIENVIEFYTTEVKDSTTFDELSSVKLPPNLSIHWDYQDDSKLEVLQEYLDYIKPKKKYFSPKPKYLTSEVPLEKLRDY